MVHGNLGILLVFEVFNVKLRDSLPSNDGFWVFFDYPLRQRLVSSKKFWVFEGRILFFEFLFWIFTGFGFGNYLGIFYCRFGKTHEAFI